MHIFLFGLKLTHVHMRQVVAGDGGCTCLVRNVELAGAGAPALAAILSMGHIAGMHAKVAKQLLDSDASRQLIAALNCPDPGVKGAAGWAVEQIASHGEETAKQLAQDGLLVALEPIYRLTPGAILRLFQVHAMSFSTQPSNVAACYPSKQRLAHPISCLHAFPTTSPD